MMPMGVSPHLTVVNLAFLVVFEFAALSIHDRWCRGISIMVPKKGKLRPQLSATAAAQDLTCEFPRQL